MSANTSETVTTIAAAVLVAHQNGMTVTIAEVEELAVQTGHVPSVSEIDNAFPTEIVFDDDFLFLTTMENEGGICL